MGVLDAPPTIAVRRGVNIGFSIALMTDAARAASTPGFGDVILTNDTHTYWRGDGATAGGVSHPTGLSNAEAVRLGIIQPRAHDLVARFRSATTAFRGIGVGNSIVQGSGASSASNTWMYKFTSAVRDEVVIGVANDWSPLNLGVGGSQIVVPMAYVADYLNTAGLVVPGTLRGPKYPYGLLMTMRNDTNTTPAVWNQRARATLRAMLQICEDVVVVSENPQMNYTTGVVTDGAAWLQVSNIMQEIAGEFGCTFVDVWAKWMMEYRAGASLKVRMQDSTHPNDLGHNLIGELVKQGVFTPSLQRGGGAIRDRGGDDPARILMPIASYTPVSVPVATSAVSVVTPTTARQTQLVEGSTVAYSLTTGQTARFDCPLPIYRVRPSVAQGNSAGGELFLDGVSLGTFSSSAGSVLEFPAASLIPATPKPGVVTITPTNAGPLRLFGVQYDCPQVQEQHVTWPGGTESGTWGAATFSAAGVADTAAVRSSSTVADYIDITWYGIYLTFAIQTGAAVGKLTEATDGGSGTTYDGYTAGTASYLYRSTPLMSVGWHTTRLTVATKNASSSANTVAVGLYRTCLPPDSSVGYIAVAQAETVTLGSRWTTATIDRALSGTPYVSGWTSGATTLALGGTGGAIVRLGR